MRVFWFTPFCLGLLVSLVINLPVSTLNFILAKMSKNTLVIVNPQGTFWHGKGDLVFVPAIFLKKLEKKIVFQSAKNNKFIFLFKDLNWKIIIEHKNFFNFGIGLKLTNKFVSWDSENTMKISFNDFYIPKGEIFIPKIDFSNSSGIFSFFKPQFKLNAKWPSFSINNDLLIEEPFSMNINLRDFESTLSPVKPLGDYDINITKKNRLISWKLRSTQDSPLVFNAEGIYSKSIRGHGELSCSKSCEYLVTLMTVIGKKKGDNLYEIVLGR